MDQLRESLRSFRLPSLDLSERERVNLEGPLVRVYTYLPTPAIALLVTPCLLARPPVLQLATSQSLFHPGHLLVQVEGQAGQRHCRHTTRALDLLQLGGSPEERVRRALERLPADLFQVHDSQHFACMLTCMSREALAQCYCNPV